MDLNLHDTEVLKRDERGKPTLERTMVPGGWIYTVIAINQRISTVFVPFTKDMVLKGRDWALF